MIQEQMHGLEEIEGLQVFMSSMRKGSHTTVSHNTDEIIVVSKIS